jgi:hypothetical protein
MGSVRPSDTPTNPPPSRGGKHHSSYYNHGSSSVRVAAEDWSGFAPPQETLFAPVLAFAPPGPNRAARAIEAINRTLPFLRRLLFHPEIDPALKHALQRIPPPESAMIDAAALYADPGIPWTQQAGGHAIFVSGREHKADFLFSLAGAYAPTIEPFSFAGEFGLKPSLPRAEETTRSVPTSVIGRLEGDTSLPSFGASALVDASALALKEIYGDFEEPWDHRQGEFNRHDKALLARLKFNAPKFSLWLGHYLSINNVLDEFSTADGPLVLVNIDAHVRTEALRPYPDLYRFYTRFSPRVLLDSTVLDRQGKRWIHAQFDHGRIILSLAIRGGMLVPLSADARTADQEIAPELITRGQWRSLTTITLDKFRTTFGLADIEFTSNYWRSGERLELASQMDSVPKLIAPPVINAVIRVIADDFMRGLAHGHGGMSVSLRSERDLRGLFQVGGALTGEMRYSPMLSLLARIGDAIANAHNVSVRNDERRLGQELFDALVDDYNYSRPRILSLDASPNPNLIP